MGGKGGVTRKLIVALVLVFLGVAQTAAGPTLSRTVDLDVPGTLEALERDNPTHYEKIRQIMVGVHKQPDAEVPRWMRTRFDARDVLYAPSLLVTDPPKRRLSFTIDDTQYHTVVTLTNLQPKLMPAK